MSRSEQTGPPGLVIEFDDRRLVATIRKYDRIFRLLTETEALSERLQSDIDSIEAEGGTAENLVNALAIKRLQLQMCPGTIAKLQNELSAIKQKMRDETQECADSLEPVLRAALESVRNPAIKNLVEAGLPEHVARSQAEVTPDVQRARGIVMRVSAQLGSRDEAAQLLAWLAELREFGTCDVQPKAGMLARNTSKGGAQ